MKPLKYIIIGLIAAAMAALMSACVDDYLYNKVKGAVEPGLPVELSLSLTVPDEATLDVLGSRASTETEIDRVVYDLYLFIFDAESNKLKTKYYFPQISSKAEISCDPAYSTSGSALIKRTGTGRGVIEHVHTTTGPSRIVAVTNSNRKGSALIRGRLSRIETFVELQEFMVSTVDAVSEMPDFEEPLTVMSGYYCDDDATHEASHLNTPCEIATDTEERHHNGIVTIGTDPLPGTVWLTPLQSRIKFVITGNGPEAVKDDAGNILIPAGHFELESWQVINLPAQTPLFCPGYGNTANQSEPTTVNSLVMTRFDSGSEVSIDDNGTKAKDSDEIFGFSFFAADNHPGKGSDNITDYGHRAAWDSTGADGGAATEPTEPTAKRYLYAPEGATYVLLRGTYTGASLVTDEDTDEATIRNVVAEVVYTIFLGHDSQTDFRDFNTYRNYKYTYKINIKGVNHITVEVNKDDEKRPDGEGHVITTNETRVILDSHYEQRVISIKKQNVIDAIEGGNFKMSVTVPLFKVQRRAYTYCDAEDNLDESEANEAVLPYMEWLEFYRHKDNELNRTYIPYTAARGNAAKKATLTVKEFMADLYQWANDKTDLTDERTYTVFFDEYVYNTNPATGEPVTWQALLNNGQPRQFSMLGTTKFATDHNSSYTTSGTTFVQRCMQTVYDVNMAGLERGWATECVEEDLFAAGEPYLPRTTIQALPAYGGAKKNANNPTSKYGRQNCWRVTSGKLTANQDCWNWNKLINDETGYFIPPANPKGWEGNENNLFSMCLQRNRDTNGNGLIDREEFKWYIPSLEQMQLLYIGYGGLTDDVQLYNIQRERQKGMINATTYWARHYLTSTHDKKVWAEEGLSVSPVGLEDNTAIWNRDAQYYIRCIRDLGMDHVKGNDIPYWIETTPAAQYQSIFESENYDAIISEETGQSTNRYKDHKRGKITLRYLNAQSLNNVARLTEIPGIVTTFTENNLPAYSFEWADTVLIFPGGKNDKTDKQFIPTLIDHLKNEDGEDSPCEANLGIGWRMPTITELTMIEWVWRLDGLGKNPNYNDFVGNKTYGYLVSRTEYCFKALELLPYRPGASPSPGYYHAFDHSGASNQFSLISKSDLTNTNNEKIPYIRCVRSYASQSNDLTEPADPARTAAGSKRKLRSRK